MRTPGAGPPDGPSPRWRVTPTTGMTLSGFHGWPFLSSARIGLPELSQGQEGTYNCGWVARGVWFRMTPLYTQGCRGRLARVLPRGRWFAIRSEQEFR